MFPPQASIALAELRVQELRDHAAATGATPRRRRTGRVGTVRRRSFWTFLHVSGEPGHLPG